jgi:hypothetical protein
MIASLLILKSASGRKPFLTKKGEFSSVSSC